MSEIIISPQGTDAIQTGGFHDDDGRRFVGITFQREGTADSVIVTFEPELFAAFAAHMAKVAEAVSQDDWWATVPRP